MAKRIQDQKNRLLLPKKQRGFFLVPRTVVTPYRDPFRANVSSLLHYIGVNGQFSTTDVTSKAWSFHFNATISTTQAKFGTSSLRLVRSGTSYIDTPQSTDFDFGSGDFTVESFVYLTSQQTTTNNWGCICCKDNITLAAASRGWNLFVDGGGAGQMAFQIFSGSTVYTVTIPAATITGWLNGWHHVAVVRSGTTLTIYGDGTSINSTSVGAASMNAINHLFCVGGMSNSASGVSANGTPDGYLAETRVTKGIARYTANFTPTTAMFPNYGP